MDFITEQISAQDAAAIRRLISEAARPGMVAFELGTFTGNSAMVMLPHVREANGRLYCVDWFRGNEGVDAAITASYQRYNILNTFLNNVKEGGYDDYVSVLVGTTDSAAAVVADGVADFIFIDADHKYSSVRQDIINWYPKLRPGGIICGHDFERHIKDCNYNRVLEKCEEDFVDGHHYGVIRAVCERFHDVQSEATVWYVRKEGSELPDAPLPAAFINLEAPVADYRPELVQQNFVPSRGGPAYNIVRWVGNYYGLSVELGPIDIGQVDLAGGGYGEKIVVGKSADAVRELIEQRGAKPVGGEAAAQPHRARPGLIDRLVSRRPSRK